MRIAHACIHCGSALTRVAPIRDAWYSLPVVVCPGCGRACVRRRHPIQARTRAAHRALLSVGALAVQLLLALTLGAFLVDGILTLDRTAMSLGDLARAEPWSVLGAGVLQPIAAGVWLTAGLSHWRRPAAWAAWGGLIGTVLAAISIRDSLVAAGWPDHIPGAGRILAGLGGDLPPQMVILGWQLAVAVAGIPLGGRLLTTAAAVRRGRWRRLRTRLRARAAGA